MSRHAYLISVWLHILAATVWLGGMLFLSLVVTPALRRAGEPRFALEVLRFAGRRFRSVGWTCLAVLLATGVVNFLGRGYGFAVLGQAEFWLSPFGHAFAAKLALVALVAALSAIHDFHIGRAATEAMSSRPGSREAENLRHMAAWIGRANIILSLVITAFAVMMVRGAP